MTVAFSTFGSFTEFYSANAVTWKRVMTTLNYNYYVRGTSLVTDGEYDLVAQGYPFEKPSSDLAEDYDSKELLSSTAVLGIVRLFVEWRGLINNAVVYPFHVWPASVEGFADYTLVFGVKSPTVYVDWYDSKDGGVSCVRVLWFDSVLYDHRSVVYEFKDRSEAVKLYQWYVRQFFNGMPR